MLRIHVLDVGHGDSLIIESKHVDMPYWSILDCHKVGNSVPTVDFLKSANITALRCIFLSHLDYDHISGLGQLIAYLLDANISVEHVFTPVLPESVKSRKELFKLLHPNDSSTAKECVDALHELQNLTDFSGNPTQIDTGTYIGSAYGSNIWIDTAHPGYEFGFISPNTQQTLDYLSSLSSKDKINYQDVNELSHVMLIRPLNTKEFFFFPGDLDSNRLRNVCNIATRVTSSEVEGNVRFIKAPHHGTFTVPVKDAINHLLSQNEKSFICVSCRPNDTKHPATSLVDHIKSDFPLCTIACTGLAHCCQHLAPLKKPIPLSLHNPKKAVFARHLASKSGAKRITTKISCHGNIMVERDDSGMYTITSSTSDYCLRDIT